MLLKIQKYYSTMNFNFVFISYSVIYAKYSYCYEVPKEQPQRYFDGKEWRIVKPRPNVRPKVARYSNITIDLDYAESPKEIELINFEETTTQMPIFDKITTTGTTKKATFKRVKKVQYRPPVRQTTKKIITTKTIPTPKFLMRAVSHINLPTKTEKTLLPHYRPVCNLKLKSSTITTMNPQLLYMKMTINRDWKENWNFWRPTKKPSPVMSNQFTPKVTKNCCIPTIKNIHVTTTKKTATKGLVTTTKKPVTPYRGSVTTTWNPKKPMNRPMMTTRKPATTIRRPTTTTKIPVTKPSKFAKLSGKQAYVGTPTENWSNLLKEFLKYVDEKKCPQPPCEHETTSTMAYSRYERIDHRKTIPKDDGLMNILMDGVEIDDRLFEEGNDGSKSKETLEYEGKRINYESFEGSLSQINNDYDDQNLKSLKDSIAKRRDITQFSKKMEYLKKFHRKNSKEDFISSLSRESFKDSITKGRDISQFPKKMNHLKKFHRKNSKEDFISSLNRESEINLDELKDKNTNEDDGILEDYEDKSYPSVLETNHAEERYLSSQIRASEEYLDELIYEDAKKEEMLQNIETKTDSAALKDKEDYMFSEIKRSGLELDDSNDSKSQKGDNVLQATDIKSYSDTLKDKYVKEAYENSQIRGSEIHSDEIIDKNIGGENEVIENNVLNYFTDALKNDHTKKENEAESDTLKDKYEKEAYENSQIRGSEIHSDEIIDKNTGGENEVIENNVLNYFTDALKTEHTKKENEAESSDSYLDGENIRNLITEKYLHDNSTETFISVELNETKDYTAPNPIELTSQTNNEDLLHDSDITFDLEDNDVKADKYPEKSTEA